MTNFREADCTITHEGRSFTSGGAVVSGNHAIVYVGEPRKMYEGIGGDVTTWHGEKLGTYYIPNSGLRSFALRPAARGFNGVKLTCYSVTFTDGSRWHGRGLGTGMMLRLRRSK
jgi:hypothetical protein